jgi:phospholipase/carboxylesterase
MAASVGDPHHNQPILYRGKPLGSAKAAVILVHGRGASAEDILSLAEELSFPEFAYYAPEAADHSWYPYSFLAPFERNQPWLDSALRLLARIVEDTIAGGVPRNKIALMGFSQGACLSTEFISRNAVQYGALIAFTGGLIGPLGTQFAYSGDLAGTPCFLGAGDPDAHVPWARVEESAAVLAKLGGEVTLRRYPGMPHTINDEEIERARNILSGLAGE